MIMSANPTKELLKIHEKCVEPGLWHAIAGATVRMPAVNSIVCYFPQGHAEHAITDVDFSVASVSIPAFILCRVALVDFLADSETDEVFAKIRLIPVQYEEVDSCDAADDEATVIGNAAAELWEKPTFLAKILTQSDANNGGGFSVPRYCADTIFPPLDYTADPPVQTLLVKDVHGEVWKFRHIFRGTPRRHLLTTGWSTFVNKKKLVSEDCIVFLKTEHGQLYVGIRRARRGIDIQANSIPGCFPKLLSGEESKVVRSGGNEGTKTGGFANVRGKGRVTADSVVEAAASISSGHTAEFVYYPRSSMPEFCVKAKSVKAAMRMRPSWCSGMRFKMPFETEDSSRISWCTGTISSVQPVDPLRWPTSPWRILQVTWDEPELLKNVKQVSPWLVEPISNVPPVHLTSSSPPRKKLRIFQHADIPVNISLSCTDFSPVNHPLGPSSTSAGIQGARHSQFGNISLPSFNLNNLQSRLFQTSSHHLDRPNPTTSRFSTDLVISNPNTQNDDDVSCVISNPNTQNDDDVSCLLTNGSPSESLKKPSDGNTPRFMLFGQPILTMEQISASNSGNSSSDGNHEKITSLQSEGLSGYKDNKTIEPESETGQCKVFVESEDGHRTLDLSALGSYEELYDRLASMFGVKKSKVMRRVLYCDGFGATKKTGDEPFSEFMKTRSLLVILDSDRGNIKR